VLEKENGNSHLSLLSTRCVVRVQNGLTVTENGESTTDSNFFISVKKSQISFASLFYHNNAPDLGPR